MALAGRGGSAARRKSSLARWRWHDTDFWTFCFGLPEKREPDDPAQLDFLQSAYAHIMGRTAYEGIAGPMTTSTDHAFAPILNAARKVVFSRTPNVVGEGTRLFDGAPSRTRST